MNFQKEIADFVQSITSDSVSVDENHIQLGESGVTFTLKPIMEGSSSGTERIIWEDQWRKNQQIVQSRIRSVLGVTQRIHGRETQVQQVSQPEAASFLNANHLLGSTPAKTKLALVKKDKILTMATFSRPTKIDREGVVFKSFELIRYCNLNNHTVIGGLSKLISYFIHTKKPDDIMTYVDKEWSGGLAFQKLGFKLVDETPPKQFWVDTNTMTRYWEEPAQGALELVKISNTGSLKYILFLK